VQLKLGLHETSKGAKVTITKSIKPLIIRSGGNRYENCSGDGDERIVMYSYIVNYKICIDFKN
jgi:hypothetical protein